MDQYVIAPPAVSSLPVVGSGQRFPVARVFCLGRNYLWGDTPGAARSFPAFFMKPASAVIEACGELAFPVQTEEFCPEIELVVALGRGGVDIPAQSALDHVYGYAAGLDLTRRDLQMAAKAAGQPWEAAKAFDGSAPVTAIQPVATVGHPSTGAVWLQVNGRERQRSTLQAQIWSVAQVISALSQSVRLQPGDLIMTGTPAGVEALQGGDLVTAGIDGVGQLSVRIRAPLAQC